MLSVSIVHLANDPQPPAAFEKASPSSNATNQSLTPTLSWQASTYADGYEYCVNTTQSCSSWASAGTSMKVTLAELNSDTLYYWQVRATNDEGTTYADSGTWRQFTTLDPAIFTESVYIPLISH